MPTTEEQAFLQDISALKTALLAFAIKALNERGGFNPFAKI
jgi:hypothetical protein